MSEPGHDSLVDKEKQAAENVDAESTDDGGAQTTTVSKKKKQKRKKGSKPIQDAEQQQPAKALNALNDQQLMQMLEQNPALRQDLATTGKDATEHANRSSNMAEILRQLKLGDAMTGMSGGAGKAKDMASYKFWSTQPVPRFGEAANDGLPDGPLEHKGVESVPKESAPLLDGFEWVTMDVTEEDQMREVYELLNGHYVEDVGANFRFDYSPALLKWALMAPGWDRDWHVGVRASTSRKLVAFISAIPVRVRVRDQTVLCSEVNFLCVHKKLRNKRLAPVLIKEVTRRSNLQGIWQGLYTGGVLLPTPVATCRYYHRAINWQKLYDTGFSTLPGDSRPQLQIRRFAVPDATTLPGFREMRSADLDSVADLLVRYQARFDMAPDFSREELEHWLLDPGRDPNQPQVIWAYVVEVNNILFPFLSLSRFLQARRQG